MILLENDQLHHSNACLWCKASMPRRRRHGSARKFCSESHRFAYHAALHRFALAQLEAGLLTVEMLRGDQESVYAVLEDASAVSSKAV